MGNIGIWQLLIVLVIVLIVFGPKRLPELGRTLGRGIREFRDSVGGSDEQDLAPGVDYAVAADETDRKPKQLHSNEPN